MFRDSGAFDQEAGAQGMAVFHAYAVHVHASSLTGLGGLGKQA